MINEIPPDTKIVAATSMRHIDGIVHRVLSVGMLSGPMGITLVSSITHCSIRAVGDPEDVDQTPVTCITCLSGR